MSAERTPSKLERTRAAILDAAEDLFSEFGFDGASLDAIGERAGIQGTAILYHFPTKRALYESTLDQVFMPLLTETDRLLDAAGNLDAALESAIEAIVSYSANHPNAPRLLLRETAAAGGGAREIMESRAAAGSAGFMGAFASRSKEHDVDPVMVWNIIVGAVCFYFVGPPVVGERRAYDPRDPVLVAEFSTTMCELTRSLLKLDWRTDENDG